jgi:hydrogenase maturation protease
MKMLVIGYGNELRQDDGVGPRLARIVAGWQRLDLEGLAVHQLTPELAEPMSQAERVVFVDAGRVTGSPRLQRLEPGGTGSAWGHACDPRDLLGLTESVYGRRPQGWLMEVPACHLGLGEELSPVAEQGLKTAAEQIRQLADGGRHA